MRLGTAAGLALVGIGVVWAQSSAVQKQPFNVDDWAEVRSAAAAAISPDGKTILYQVSFGAKKGKTNHEWHTIGVDGSDGKKLELPEGFEPFGFTSDGAALYGSYTINKLGQFAVFELKTLNERSAPRTSVLLPRGIKGAVPSPDGSHYALLADPRAPDELAETRAVIEPDETSIYMVNRDGTGGSWQCPDLNYISNTLTVGGASPAVAWSADGSIVATVSTAPKIGHHYIRSWIDSCSASGSKRLAEISNSVSGIAWMGDGQKLAFVSTSNSVLTPDEVYTIPAAGGKAVDVTPTLNGTAVAIVNDAHGHVWTLVAHGVQADLEEFTGEALKPAQKWDAGCVAGLPVFSPYRKGTQRLAYSVADPAHQLNVAVDEAGALKKITNEGEEALAKTSLGAVKTVHWTSKEGVPLEGIVTFPAGYTEGEKAPYLVLPHGGPEANDLLRFDAFSRIIAGLGYVVMQPEYRGSTGYGDKFLDAIYQHFGDRAYSDVDSATDYAVAQGWADPNRLAIFGWSAGGFMTSWTVTQTARYKAAIEGAGITDWASFIWTSDVQQIDFDARWPSRDPEAFRRFSAVDFVENVKTPILVLHGGADFRVPTYQGREYFESLLAHGKTTRMVEYPGSPHFPIVWEQRRNVFREIADWLKKYDPV